jgi:hypothetical protein
MMWLVKHNFKAAFGQIIMQPIEHYYKAFQQSANSIGDDAARLLYSMFSYAHYTRSFEFNLKYIVPAIAKFNAFLIDVGLEQMAMKYDSDTNEVTSGATDLLDNFEWNKITGSFKPDAVRREHYQVTSDVFEPSTFVPVFSLKQLLH